MPNGVISPHNLEKDGGLNSAKAFRDLADKEKLVTHLIAGFEGDPDYHPARLDNASTDEILQWARERLAVLLDNLVRKTDEGYLPTYFTFVNEAIYYSPRFNRVDWQTPGILYKVYGKQWISEAYAMVFQFARERGLRIGKDIIMLYNDNVIDLERRSPDFLHLVLLQTKREIAERLGIPFEQVQLNVGIQLHLTLHSSPDKDYPYVPPPSDEELLGLINRYSDIGRIHLTEFDIKSAPSDRSKMETLLRIIRTATRSRRVNTIEFWNTFSYEITTRGNPFDYGPNGFFDENYQPTDFYKSLCASLLTVS